MKNSPALSMQGSALRRLAPVLAACVLVFGSQAAEVADAAPRRTPTPRRAAPMPRPAEAVREAVPASQSLGQVSGESVNFRLGPGMQHAVAGSLRAGDYVKARAKQNGWLEIDWPKSVPAWIEKSDVRVSSRGGEAMGLISGKSARVYSAGHTKASVLATLSKGAPVEILGEQGTWFKVKAPAGATAYISARYVVTGLSAPAKPAAPVTPVKSAPMENVAARKPEVPAQTNRVIPRETPVAPPPISKAVLPAPVAPAAIAPEEPSEAFAGKAAPTQKAIPAEAAAPAEKLAVETAKPAVEPVAETAKPTAEPALETEKPVAVLPTDDATDSLPPLDALVPVPSISAILEHYEALPVTEEPDATAAAIPVATDPAQELKQALDALRAPADTAAPPAPAAPAQPVEEVKTELARAIEETRQSIKQDEPRRSVIDDSLVALETARLAAEARRREEEEKQRASLNAALKQFEALETRRRSEPEQPIDLGIDARTGIFLAPPEPAQPDRTEKTDKISESLLNAFETDQAKLALERDQAALTDAIRRADEWRALDTEDTAHRDDALRDAEQDEHLSKLLAEDVQRLAADSERALDLKKQIDALEAAHKAAPVAVAKPAENPEQELLQALENARRMVQRSETIQPETVLPAAPAETAKPKLETEKPAVVPVPEENKYGHFLDPNDALLAPEPKAKTPVEELRSLMFPPESVEPLSSKLPDIGRTVIETAAAPEVPVTDESAKSVEVETPAAQPVSAKKEELPSIHDVRGIEVIPEPEGTIHEDMFRETSKRVKNKFVVPGNAPAPLGRRAEVISLDE